MRFPKTLQQFCHDGRRAGQSRYLATRKAKTAARRRSVRLNLEHLEDRLTPATFNAADVPGLIADINSANSNGVANTINLTTPGIYLLTAVNNSTDGPTGLPLITSSAGLTINGNLATIARSTAATPFRLFEVASGAKLTLKNVILQQGLAFGGGVSAEGGAIFNQGNLILNGVTVELNTARGSNAATSSAAGQNAAGGGIYSSGGSLTLTGSTLFSSNSAFAGNGGGSGAGGASSGGGISANQTKVSMAAGCVIESCYAIAGNGLVGGSASGGGLYATGTSTALVSISLTSATLQKNQALGGIGGQGAAGAFTGGTGGSGGNSNGGGLFVNDALLTLSGDHVLNNAVFGGHGGRGGGGFARGGPGGQGGDASGGGLYASSSSLTESSFLVVQNNQAQAGTGGGGGAGFPTGGPGGNGGSASGGGMYTTAATVKLTSSPLFQSNSSVGGLGGLGGSGAPSFSTGGPGGNGGNGSGGALYASASGTISLILENAILEGNATSGGFGGSGTGSLYFDHRGGSGGASSGGAVYLAQNATLLNDNIRSNLAGEVFSPQGGTFTAGGALGGSFTHAGVGGDSAGGGLFVAAGTITVGSSAIDNNAALGGRGGNSVHINSASDAAGAGGAATGGAVAVIGGTLSLKSCGLESNYAIGGFGGGHYNASGGGFSGRPALQGAGGGAYGAGLYVSFGTLHLTLDDVENNYVIAGYSKAGFGAQSKSASGGGLYKAGGTTTIDAFTFAHIINNTASSGAQNIGP